MKAIIRQSTVKEPAAKYQTKQWTPTKSNVRLVKKSSTFIKDGTNIYRQPTTNKRKRSLTLNIKPRPIKISSLRGTFTKQTKEEIDIQLRKLRDEWDRGF